MANAPLPESHWPLVWGKQQLEHFLLNISLFIHIISDMNLPNISLWPVALAMLSGLTERPCCIQHLPQISQISIWQQEHSWVSLNFHWNTLFSVFSYFHISFLHTFHLFNNVFKMFRVEIFLGFLSWAINKSRVKPGSYSLLPLCHLPFLAIASPGHSCWVAGLLQPQILYRLIASGVFSIQFSPLLHPSFLPPAYVDLYLADWDHIFFQWNQYFKKYLFLLVSFIFH